MSNHPVIGDIRVKSDPLGRGWMIVAPLQNEKRYLRKDGTWTRYVNNDGVGGYGYFWATKENADNFLTGNTIVEGLSSQQQAEKPYSFDEECIIYFAMRYALGRTTGAVGVVVSQMKKNWGRIKDSTKDAMKREIQTAVEMGEAGDRCDVEEWTQILRLTDRPETQNLILPGEET